MVAKEPVAAVIAVPSVGAEPFPPGITNVSVSYVVPFPIVNDHDDALPALVTFGTLVVTNFDELSVLVGTATLPLIAVIAFTVPSAPTAVQLAEALKYLVVAPAEMVGLVSVKVVSAPKTLSVLLLNVALVNALSSFVLSVADIAPLKAVVASGK